ncbi:MAG: 50S ribosomal protein L24 [Candidatus Paceibacterota bacterium]|nr:50S ribosomal protein L24 [Candidatus Nomurabacteria bacterium]
MASKIKKGDNVIVISGADKGKKGKVEKIFPLLDRVLVSGVNMKKKHEKKGGNTGGQIVDVPRPVHISNVALVDPKTGKATRVGFATDKDKKVRIARKSGQIVK